MKHNVYFSSQVSCDLKITGLGWPTKYQCLYIYDFLTTSWANSVTNLWSEETKVEVRAKSHIS